MRVQLVLRVGRLGNLALITIGNTWHQSMHNHTEVKTMTTRLHMRAEYLRCRTLGHAWEDFIPEGVRARWGELQTWRCVRCTTERHDVINALGALGSRRYVYPPDYKLAADETPTRDAFRVELGKALQRDARARVNGRRTKRKVAA